MRKIYYYPYDITTEMEHGYTTITASFSDGTTSVVHLYSDGMTDTEVYNSDGDLVQNTDYKCFLF